MSNSRAEIYIRMCKRFGTATTARHLVETEGLTYTQAIKYLATIAKPAPLTRAEEARMVDFINNQ